MGQLGKPSIDENTFFEVYGLKKDRKTKLQQWQQLYKGLEARSAQELAMNSVEQGYFDKTIMRHRYRCEKTGAHICRAENTYKKKRLTRKVFVNSALFISFSVLSFLITSHIFI